MKKRLSMLPQGIIIASLALVLYLNTLSHDFALDDAIVISENMFTQQGISGWKGLLTEDTFYGFFKEEGKAQLVAGGRYRPLSPMLFALIYQVVGNNPFVFHLLNIILYSVCCWLVFVFIRTFCRRLHYSDAELIGFFGALLFTTHAVHTEVVANIKGADEILSTIGGILCMLSLLKYQSTQQLKFLIAGLLAFFLSLLAKENTTTLLAIAPLILWVTKSATDKTWIKSAVALLITFIAYFIIRSTIVGWPWESITPTELMNNPFLKYDGPAVVSVSFSEKFGTIFYTLLVYLKLLIFPQPLIHDYYPRQIPIHALTNILSLLSLLVHSGLLIFSIFILKKKKLVSFAILFYLLAMSITSNVVFPVGTNMSERFLFFPSIGFCLIGGFLFYKLFDKNNVVGGIILLITLSAFSYKTITRNAAWKNNFTLFQTDVKLAPNSAKLRNAAAGSLMAKYESVPASPAKNDVMDEAIEHLKVALHVHPNYKNAHLLKGNAHLYKNEFDQAIISYNNALRLDPTYREAKNNLQITYRSAGRFYGEKENDLDKSLIFLKQAYELNPDDSETIRLLGVVYGVKGTHTKAIEYFNKLVERSPKNVEYLKMLANALHHNGQIEDRDLVLQQIRQVDNNK